MTLSSEPVQLSVVIPVYNEERNIRETLRRIEAFLSLKNISWEVCVVSDGSKDGTVDVLEDVRRTKPQLPLKILRSDSNHGKGFASRRGMLEARGRYVLLTDADLSAPIKESDRLTAALEKGADVAIGSRAVREKDCDVRQSLKRHISGRIFNFFVQLLVLPGIRDSQCGFKCFTRAAAQKLFSAQKLDGFSFDAEVLYLARKNGYKIAEVPVMWSQGADSRISLFRDSFRMLKDLFKIKKLH
jgi:dolichyl-phosphate beta-glucosyltransferase